MPRIPSRLSTILLVVAAVTTVGCTGDPTWPDLEREIEETFPDVEALSTAELAARLEAGETILLLDVREPEEIAISTIPGAIPALEYFQPQAGTDAVDAAGDLEGVDAVVLYCSIGYRSAAAARELAARTNVPVLNLDGSIFRWANEGRPLITPDGEPTTRVHPYSRTWGRLLEPEHRAPLK